MSPVISDRVVFSVGLFKILNPPNNTVEIERLLHACENELDWLDLAINFKKSCCVRIGPRYDATCVPIAIYSLSGHLISCSDEVRYLGIYITSSRVFKCSVSYAKRNC